jgi:serine/threonine protein kinase
MTSLSVLVNNWRDMNPTLEDEAPIGEGTFGKVYIVKCAGHNGVRRWDAGNFAVKIPKPQLDLDQNFMKEVQCMAKVDYPACLKLRALNIGFGQRSYIMDMMPSSLQGIINAAVCGLAPPAWDDTAKSCAILGIAAGLAYLHSQKPKIIHRDIKPANILMDTELRPRISDFGLARMVSVSDQIELTQGCGTPAFMAPELWTGNSPVTEAVDVYAFGLTVWSIFTNQMPFEGLPIDNLRLCVVSGQRPQIPGWVPERYAQMISTWWAPNPEDRGTMISVLNNADALILGACDRGVFEDYKQLLIAGLAPKRSR